MLQYFLDFHENIRFSKTLTEYQEQYNTQYPIQKTTTVFLDPWKKRVTFVRYSWNSQGILLYSIFPEHYFGIFPGISWGIFSKYTGNISREWSTNIPWTYICSMGNGFVRKVTTFVKSSYLMLTWSYFSEVH